MIHQNGKFSWTGVCKLVFLALLYSIGVVAALAINDLVQKSIEKFVKKKEQLFDEIIYVFITFGLLIIVAYIGCKYCPDVVEKVNVFATY